MIARRQAVAVALSIAAAFYAFGVYRQLLSIPVVCDFDAYYLPAVQLRKGMNPYLATLPGTVLRAADTPTWMLCFVPLAMLSRYTAYWTWFWINVGAVLVSIWLLIRESDLKGADALSVAAILWMYPPLATNFWFGQSEIFLCMVLVLMLVALRRDHDRLAGLALAAAALLRAYPLGLLGYLVVLRRWKALGWTFAGLIVGGAVTILLVGWSTVVNYAALIGVSGGAGLFGRSSALHVPAELIKHPANLNLGWFIKWLYDRTSSRPIPAYVTIGAVLAEIAAVAICFRATARIRADDLDWRGYGLWIVTITLISPLAFSVFFCCFLPMIAGMAAAFTRQEISRGTLYAIAGSYLVMTVLPSGGHPLFPIMHAAMLVLEKNHEHLVHVFAESEFAALVLAWLAAFWFVRAARDRFASGSI